MARHSQWEAIKREVREAQRHLAKHGRRGRLATGYGPGYPLNRRLPASPPTAYFLRRYASLWDALCAWRVDVTARGEATKEQLAMVPPKKEAATKILAGLREPNESGRAFALKTGKNSPTRRDNYEAAKRELMAWCEKARRDAGMSEDDALPPDHPEPRVRVAWEMLKWMHPLLLAYSNPRQFFAEIAPGLDSNRLFNREKLMPNGLLSRSALALVLHTWGYGALLNPEVRRAFDAADSGTLSDVLAEAEGKEAFREGREPGRKDSKPRPKRLDGRTGARVNVAARKLEERGVRLNDGGETYRQRALTRVAERQHVSRSAIKKRIQRERRATHKK